MSVRIAVVLAAISLAAAALQAQTQQSNAVQVCASDTDHENLCSWNSAAGTHGRKCSLDVERMDGKARCDYNSPTVTEPNDHRPMCFSVSNAEHIAFSSSQGRKFRVRRFVPITKTNPQGQPCPADPFNTPFDPHNVAFGNSFDTMVPKAAAVGCSYKLEVQFQNQDPNAPPEIFDSQQHRYECRDPHLMVTQ